MKRRNPGEEAGQYLDLLHRPRIWGALPPSIDTIDERLWAGLYTLIQTRIGDGSFGLHFPEQCPDGNGPCGCDEQAFRRVLAAEVPWIEWPLSATETPETPVILDLLEFCARAVGEPSRTLSVSGDRFQTCQQATYEIKGAAN